MSLTLYKRHRSKTCKVHKLKIATALKKHYRDCECPVWITGTTSAGDWVPRQCTNLVNWDEAESYKTALNNRRQSTELQGRTVAECMTTYLDSRRAGVRPKVHRQIELNLERLMKYAESCNVSFMSQLDEPDGRGTDGVDLLENFKVYGLSTIREDTSKETALNKVKTFLTEAFRRGWIKSDLARKVKPIGAVAEMKQPYEAGELQTILEHATALNGGTSGYATNGTTFALLIEFMVLTGLRVSDAVRFDPSKLRSRHNGLWSYTFIPKKTTRKKGKQPKPVTTYLTADFKARLGACTWFSKALPFAYLKIDLKGLDDTLERAVYERMQHIGQRAGIVDCRPHRLRDTFAVNMLAKGLGLDDVCRLLGHSSVKVTEDYYASWALDRELRLERLVGQALL